MKQLYGKETEKALINFPFTYHRVHLRLIHAIVVIKKAAALANMNDQGIDTPKGQAIVSACDTLLTHAYDDQFVTCALQGGAGTSLHSNVNEVIAALAGEGIDPLDHVNKSQSTNDVNPSALRIVSYQQITNISEALRHLSLTLHSKAEEGKEARKLGRTHLQDAVPTTVAEEFFAYRAIVDRHLSLLTTLQPMFLELNLGGTAIGNGMNATDVYRNSVYQELRKITGLDLTPLSNLMSGTSSQTDFLTLANTVTSIFCDLSKISSDIRLLVSGPNGGIGELSLPGIQNGSTIMPGKTNPVSLEVINQMYFLFAGLSTTIREACHAAQLELGVMFPVLADSLLTMLTLAEEGVNLFSGTIDSLVINKDRCIELLEKTTAYAALLTPILGHARVSDIVSRSVHEKRSFASVLLEEESENQYVLSLLQNEKITH